MDKSLGRKAAIICNPNPTMPLNFRFATFPAGRRRVFRTEGLSVLCILEVSEIRCTQENQTVQPGANLLGHAARFHRRQRRPYLGVRADVVEQNGRKLPVTGLYDSKIHKRDRLRCSKSVGRQWSLATGKKFETFEKP